MLFEGCRWVDLLGEAGGPLSCPTVVYIPTFTSDALSVFSDSIVVTLTFNLFSAGTVTTSAFNGVLPNTG